MSDKGKLERKRLGRLGLSSVILLILFWSSFSSWGEEGYSYQSERLMVNTKEHWTKWSGPHDVMDISDDGSVMPRYIRKNINAVLDASKFVHDKELYGGLRAAGSNLKDAPNIIDGNLNTFWEPSKDDITENWWVEIDLGRLVTATKLVIKFVPEGKGDPFLRFRAFASKGMKTFEGIPSSPLNYWEVANVDNVSLRKRYFEFEISPQLKTSMGTSAQSLVSLDALQYIKIQVTHSLRDKAELVSQSEYEALDPDLRGSREYFKLIRTTGKERQVSQSVYEKLPPAEQGTVKYYRREIPRLAEIEVWTPGENISLGILDRGGGGDLFPPFRGVVSKCMDGSYESFTQVAFEPSRVKQGDLVLDLGATFWVDEVRFIGGDGRIFSIGLGDYELLGATVGSLSEGGQFRWEKISSWKKEQNFTDMYFTGRNVFEPRKLRFVAFRFLGMGYIGACVHSCYFSTEIEEFQAYGEGYIPEIILRSPLIELGEGRTLNTIEWQADTPPGTKIKVSTRTGDTVRELKHYYNKSGAEVTEMQYNKLPSFSKGPIKIEVQPTADWSVWSQPYSKPGDRILSPAQRKYMQIEVTLSSDDPKAGGRLHSLTVNLSKSLAKHITVKITPSMVEKAGVLQEFSAVVAPSFAAGDPGFDQIMVQAISGVDAIRFVSLNLGSTEEPKIVPTHPDSLWLILPKMVSLGQSDSINIKFRSNIYGSGAIFRVLVGNSKTPDVWQKVDPIESNLVSDLRILLLDTKVISDLVVKPSIFTPNDDGVNDQAEINFVVGQIAISKMVDVDIYDLSGRRMRSLNQHRSSPAMGRYSLLWDGKDDRGRRVPPGIYVLKVHIDTDNEDAFNRTSFKVINVAY